MGRFLSISVLVMLVIVVVYERAKGIHGEQAFGTERDVNEVGNEYLLHSTGPLEEPDQPHRVTIGGPDCTQPYSMALRNVSAMSFGSLSANAIRALNKGARLGAFAHDTGEGGLSRYHVDNGGDLVWEIGSGYFSTRTDGVMIVHNALVGTGLRDRIRLAASGKVAAGNDIVKRMMEATVKQAAQMMTSMGARTPRDLDAQMLRRNVTPTEHYSYAELYEWLQSGELLPPRETWAADWAAASADSFRSRTA